jgi:nitroreductase
MNEKDMTEDGGVAPFDLVQTDRLLTTTRAVRRRLDFERPVEIGVVLDCLRLATHAPNASNHQDWKWIVVTDRDLRRQIGEEYRRLVVPLVEAQRARAAETGDRAEVRILDATLYLAGHMAEVPVMVIPCIEFTPGPSVPFVWTASMLASIYPAVWSFELALRSRGLGSVLTTALLLDDAAIRKVLAIPDNYTHTCLIPVAHTQGGDFRPARRRPLQEVVVRDGWHGRL